MFHGDFQRLSGRSDKYLDRWEVEAYSLIIRQRIRSGEIIRVLKVF